MPRFFPLQVADIHRDTRDSVVLTLMPKEEHKASFEFIQGQYLTFRKQFEGEELRRSYSICAAVDEGCLRVGIKRVQGGSFSTWANEELKSGDWLEAMPPMGRFHYPIEPEHPRNYVAFAGGSGITPVLSLIKTTLALEPDSRFTLIYGNRSVSSIMFREELEDLKNTYMGRFSLLHILENEAQDIDLFSGRIDAQKCQSLFEHWIDISSVERVYICGPEPMMLTIADALRAHGLQDEQIKFELFASDQPGRAPSKARSNQIASQGGNCKVTITLDGVDRDIQMRKDQQSLLEAALEAKLDAPYACKAGVCSSCRAMVLEGEVDMIKNHALEDYEVNRGYILTCQCYPLSDRLVFTYDQ